MIEPATKFEDLKIPLRVPAHGVSEISAVLGIPEWWTTGSRVAVALAHGSTSNLDDPLITSLHRELSDRQFMTLRFNFPFAEAGKRASADSFEVLEAAFLAALGALGRDPRAAPAHLFLGGVGLGARVASRMATGPIRLDGLFFLGYPLHAQDKPEQAQPEDLYRIIAPMLFVQGTRDRTCDIDTLRTTLARVGAPTQLRVVEDADAAFRVTKKSGIDAPAVHAAVFGALNSWIESNLENA